MINLHILLLFSFLHHIDTVGFPFAFVVSVDGLCWELGVLQFAAVGNDDTLFRVSTGRADGFNGLDNIPAELDLSKDDVLAIQPLAAGGRAEELRSIGVLSRVGHTQQTRTVVGDEQLLSVPFRPPFVLELSPIDGLSSGSVPVRDVTSLVHKSWNDAVEAGSLVVQWLAALSSSLFSCT